MCHCTCNLFDVIWLIGNSNTSNTWQIDQSQIWASVRVNLQNNRFIDDIFVVSAKFVCEPINVVSDLWKICKLFAWDFFRENTVGFNIFRNMIKTKFKRSSGYDTITTR
jgi:hypothetical protein